MRISQLLKSDLVGDRTIIEIWRKPLSQPTWQRAGKWELAVEGFKDEYSILKFEGSEIRELYYKSYPETFSIYL